MFTCYTHQDYQEINTVKKANVLILVRNYFLSSEVSEAFNNSGHSTYAIHDENQVNQAMEKEKFDLIFIKDRPKSLYLKLPKIFYGTYSMLFLRELQNCVLVNDLKQVFSPNFLNHAVQYLLLESSESMASNLINRN